jgi:hypothetical protein
MLLAMFVVLFFAKAIRRSLTDGGSAGEGAGGGVEGRVLSNAVSISLL